MRPLLIRTGGTLPIVPALAEKGIPTILTGFALPDSNIHSPNEKMEVEYLEGHRGGGRAVQGVPRPVEPRGYRLLRHAGTELHRVAACLR